MNYPTKLNEPKFFKPLKKMGYAFIKNKLLIAFNSINMNFTIGNRFIFKNLNFQILQQNSYQFRILATCFYFGELCLK